MGNHVIVLRQINFELVRDNLVVYLPLLSSACPTRFGMRVPNMEFY